MQLSPRQIQILATSARLFRKKGYAATTVRHIASELGMEAASLYNHIRSKQEILQLLLLNLAEKFTLGMNQAEKAQATIDQLESLIRLHIRLTFENPDQMALISGEWVHLDEDAQKKFLNLRQDYEKRFKNILSRGMQEGILYNGDLDLALFTLISTLNWLCSWVNRHPGIEEDFVVAEIKRNLIFGLANRNS